MTPAKGQGRRALILFMFVVCLIIPTTLFGVPNGRFLVMGDGILVFAGSKGPESIRFRDRGADYHWEAVQTINRRFNTDWNQTPVSTASVRGGQAGQTRRRRGKPARQKDRGFAGGGGRREPPMIELRLIEALDAIADHFGGKPLVLISGYRSRGYNQGLRDQGRMAAQSSMHIEGGAADFHLQGIDSADVAAYARSLECCGVGYYHGREIHIDVGPVRSWDEVTSGTESREPQQNANIILSTRFDRYRSGDEVQVRFMRMTALPIAAPASMALECEGRKGWQRVRWVSVLYNDGVIGAHDTNACRSLDSVGAVRSGRLQVKGHRRCHGAYRLRATFCERASEKMPAAITSNLFIID